MNQFLTSQEQKIALALARKTIEDALETESKTSAPKLPEIFAEKRGVFVTLHKHGELRGCIGLIEPIKTLGKAIEEMALSSAFDDYRFSPVTKKEWSEIKIEISVLTVPEKIDNPNKIILGKHGVIIKSGLRSGVFLPQVAEETGWNLEEFMDELCTQKAGLSKNAWRDDSAEIYIFEAQILKE
ncbi:MAG: AmmeMemoRadiSam system protein A [Patescibacteria group bacterium]|nr:AmmeMemoRadiSam system protein A [Patescibacteria group bacterium]